MEYKDQAIKRRRESNIELLRIIAMFMVLVVHADFLSLDKPSPEEITIMPLNAFARFFFESASIVCVNVFVLISGWFGIRFSAKGFCKFAFTCVFLLAVVYIAVLITDFNSFFADGLKGLYHKFELNWFIKAYMCLYFLAPVLNAFVDNSERKTQQTVLIGFFAIQTYYGWFTTTAGYFASGYSPLSFIGLYLLARYIHKFSPKWSTWKPSVYLSIYAALTIAMASLYFILQKHGVIHIEILNWYNNPMVIASSLSLLLYFRILPIRRGGELSTGAPHRVLQYFSFTQTLVY